MYLFVITLTLGMGGKPLHWFDDDDDDDNGVDVRVEDEDEDEASREADWSAIFCLSILPLCLRLGGTRGTPPFSFGSRKFSQF